MRAVLIIFFFGVGAYAFPQGQGKVGADVNHDFGKTPTLNLHGSQHWLSNDKNSQIGLSGSHTRELGGLNRHETKAGVDGSHTMNFDRGSLNLNANHQRELFGQVNRHQTNAGVQGSLDVFKANNDRTKASVFGGASQQWNSHSPNVKSYEYGGRLEHTWSRG